jgi:quinol monooxygenase YgiN
MSVTVMVELPAQPDKADEMQSFIRTIVADTRTFAGFEHVAMYRNLDDPHIVVLLETWASRGHHEKYLAWRTERGDLEKIVSLLAGAPSIRYFEDADL